MRCPNCNKNTYQYHKKINKSGTEIERDYHCLKCNHVFKTIERIIDTNEQTIFKGGLEKYEK